MVEDTESRLETASSTARDSLKTMQSIEQSLVARLQRLDKELDAVRTTCSDNNSVADSKVRSVLVGGWALDRVLVPFLAALFSLRLVFSRCSFCTQKLQTCCLLSPSHVLSPSST